MPRRLRHHQFPVVEPVGRRFGVPDSMLDPTQLSADVHARMQRDMNEQEIAKALKARLSELRTHLAKVNRELQKRLPADSEDQAIELENQEALEVIKKTETTEIRQIEAALKRISEGTYGTCAKCGEPIDPRRLKALPTAPTCISCSA
jgi:RNA polymerase-binding protein DksA